LESILRQFFFFVTWTCSLTNRIFSAKDARRMHQKDDAEEKDLSQPTLDCTDMPLRHQKQIQLLPIKSAQHQPPQSR